MAVVFERFGNAWHVPCSLPPCPRWAAWRRKRIREAAYWIVVDDRAIGFGLLLSVRHP
jgi:hypothetical protein